jgi:hypothetical protein
MPPLQVDMLLERAIERSRSNRLGDCADIHLEGLRELAASIDTKQLDTQGRRMVEEELTWWLEKCLNFERDLALYPDLHDVPIVEPT